MQTRYKEKLMQAGDMIFGVVFPEYRKGGKRRGRFQPTSEVQARNNERRAAEWHRLMVHANFVRNDYFTTLTYDDDSLPATKAVFDRDVRNFIRRIKRAYKAAGLELKYYMEKVSGDGVRPHAHVYLSGGIDRNIIDGLWGRGYCNTRRLQFNECGVQDLATYSGMQHVGERTRRRGEHRYSGSRNLKKPVERTNLTRYSKAAVEEIADAGNPQGIFAARYKGYWLAEFPQVYQNPVTHGWRMTFVLYNPFSDNLEPYVKKRNQARYRVDESGIISEKWEDFTFEAGSL